MSTPARNATGAEHDAQCLFRMRCARGRDYGVHLTRDVLALGGMLDRLLAPHPKALIVSTPTVWSIYGARADALLRARSDDLAVLVLDVDEASKSLANATRIAAECQDRRIGRTDALVAVGGGVCSDLVTVAASLVRRGIAHLRVPTTLVGQIDAGIGAKGAVNHRGAKSFLGCFHPPEEVLIDPDLLATAPERTLRDGLAEAVKIAIVSDARLFELLEANGRGLASGVLRRDRTDELVRRAALRMLEELQPNLYEDRTHRRKVDFGHTFSPLVEQRSAYAISHGHAVAIDMALSASIAVTLGQLDSTTQRRIIDLLTSLALPLHSPLLTLDLCQEAVRGAALHRGGAPNLVIPTAIGACTYLGHAELSEKVLADALRRCFRATAIVG